jgi:hypothetical protein
VRLLRGFEKNGGLYQGIAFSENKDCVKVEERRFNRRKALVIERGLLDSVGAFFRSGLTFSAGITASQNESNHRDNLSAPNSGQTNCPIHAEAGRLTH